MRKKVMQRFFISVTVIVALFLLQACDDGAREPDPNSSDHFDAEIAQTNENTVSEAQPPQIRPRVLALRRTAKGLIMRFGLENLTDQMITAPNEQYLVMVIAMEGGQFPEDVAIGGFARFERAADELKLFGVNIAAEGEIMTGKIEVISRKPAFDIDVSMPEANGHSVTTTHRWENGQFVDNPEETDKEQPESDEEAKRRPAGPRR